MQHSLRNTLSVGTILILTLISFTLMGSKPVSAQAEQETPVETTSGSFTYVANSGDNLTLLVRKSVQLYTASNNTELSEGQKIAAETCAVQKMGAFELNVGQEVVVTEADIKEAVEKSTSLNESQIATWASYGPIARTTDTKPTSAPEYVATEDLTVTEPTEEPEGAEEPANTTEATLTDATDDEEADQAPWYWWVIGGGALAGMWYVLGGNEVIASRRKK